MPDMDLNKLHTRCDECGGYRFRSSGKRQPWHERLHKSRAEFMKAHGLNEFVQEHLALWHASEDYAAAGPGDEELREAGADRVPCGACDGRGYYLTVDGSVLAAFVRMVHPFPTLAGLLAQAEEPCANCTAIAMLPVPDRYPCDECAEHGRTLTADGRALIEFLGRHDIRGDR